MAFPSQPHNHDELLAALSGAFADAASGNSTKPNHSKPPFKLRAAGFALFWGRVILGLAILGAAFWALGYILAWQNILPFTPEWWHGFAIAFAFWAVQVITPPTITVKTR